MRAYYDNESGKYLIPSPSGLLALSKTDMTERLIRGGLSNKRSTTEVSEAIVKLQEIQDNRRIDMALQVAGWNRGLYTWSGKRILVPEQLKTVVPAEGDWKPVELWHECVMGSDPLQITTWRANEKLFEEMLLNQRFRQLAINALIGPPKSGKTFTQERKTEQITGRVADPWPYANNLTPFNSELFTAEHLLIGDPPILDRNDRGDFANMIKQLTAEYQVCHRKFSEPIMLPPLRFSTLSCNDELHNLAIRTLDTSLRDKINLFKCGHKPFPPEEYRHLSPEEFLELIRSCYPAYKWHLLNEFKIPDELRLCPDGRQERFGCRVYHHPDLVALIEDNTPEKQFLDVLDELGLCSDGPWEGPCSALIDWLDEQESPRIRREYLQKAGLVKYYLGKLKSTSGDRVKQAKRMSKKRGFWLILPKGHSEQVNN